MILEEEEIELEEDEEFEDFEEVGEDEMDEESTFTEGKVNERIENTDINNILVEDTEVKELPIVNKNGSVKGVKSVAKIVLTNEQTSELFKSLIHKTSVEAAKEYGIHHMYTTDGALRMFVHNLVKKVTKAPELYGLTPDAVAIVLDALQARKFKAGNTSLMVKEREALEFKDKLAVIRDTATTILQKKLNKINKNQKDIDNIPIKDILAVMATATDKHRLVQGESTENVTNYSKIDVGSIKPQDALALVLKAREAYIEGSKN